MPTRASLEDKLAALRALRGRTLAPVEKADLKKRIGDRSNLVVASAATLAGENGLAELAKDLESAFERFLVDPLKDDKLCRAKLAIVQALDRMEHQDTGVFLKAAKYVQLEPGWGRADDTAAPLRAAALVALARVEGHRCVPLLVDAMVDPERDVRTAAAVALGAVGSEAAGMVLRLKVRLGDKDPDVFSECLGALLAVNPEENLPIVSEFLDPMNAERCEAAALALGRSRLPSALGPLGACSERCRSPELRSQVLLAIAMLRRPEAIDFLAGLVSSESEATAIEALAALKIHKHDPRLRERIAKLVQERGGAMLQARFDREFRVDGS